MSQQAETMSDKDVNEFFDKLEEFRAGLDETDQKQLAALVVLATDQQEEATKEVSGITSLPSDEEIDSFAKKLNEFHDSLPGDQHKILDALVGQAVARDESEVQGHEWVNLHDGSATGMWIPANNRQLRRYAAACDYIGGDLYNYGTKWYQGRKWRYVGCWVGE